LGVLAAALILSLTLFSYYSDYFNGWLANMFYTIGVDTGEVNYFGSSRSRLINLISNLDLSDPTIITVIGLGYILMLLFASVYASLLVPAIIYLALLGFSLYGESKAFEGNASFFGFGYPEKYRKYLLIGIIVAIIYFGGTLVVSGLFPGKQTIISAFLQQIPAAPISISGSAFILLAYFVITAIMTTYTETNFFAGYLLPTVSAEVGAVPAVIIVGVANVILHGVIMGWNPIGLTMTLVRVLIIYSICTKEQSKTPELMNHFIINGALVILRIMGN
jgi:membrane protease YdiL (CAAX protease family)